MTIQYRRMAQTSVATYSAVEVTFSPSVPRHDRSEIAQKVSEYRKTGVPPQDGDIIAVGNSDNDGATERHYRLVAYSGEHSCRCGHSNEEILYFQAKAAPELNDENLPLGLMMGLGIVLALGGALAWWAITQG